MDTRNHTRHLMHTQLLETSLKGYGMWRLETPIAECVGKKIAGKLIFNNMLRITRPWFLGSFLCLCFYSEIFEPVRWCRWRESLDSHSTIPSQWEAKLKRGSGSRHGLFCYFQLLRAANTSCQSFWVSNWGCWHLIRAAIKGSVQPKITCSHNYRGFKMMIK